MGANRNGQLKRPKTGELGIPASGSSSDTLFSPGDVTKQASILDLERMFLRDATAQALETGLTGPVKGTKGDFEEAEGDKGEAEFCREVLLTPPYAGGTSVRLESVIALMAGAFARRIAPFEIVWQPRPDGKDVIEKLVFLRASTCTLKEDGGITQEGYDGNGVPFKIDIPANKSFVYIHGNSSTNPLAGESLFETAYQEYEHKKKIRYLEGLYLQGHALPKTIVKSNAPDREQVVKNAQALQGGGVMAVNIEDEVDLLYGGTAVDYRAAEMYCDSQMAISVHLQALLLSVQTQTGSRALADEQFDFFDLGTRARLSSIAQRITESLAAPLVRYNFGEDAAFPKFVFPPTSDEDKKRAFDAWTQLLGKAGIQPDPQFVSAVQEKVAQWMEIDLEKLKGELSEEAEEPEQTNGDSLNGAGRLVSELLGKQALEDEDGESVELHLGPGDRRKGSHLQKSHGGWAKSNPYHKSKRIANLKSAGGGSASTRGGGTDSPAWEGNIQPKPVGSVKPAGVADIDDLFDDDDPFGDDPFNEDFGEDEKSAEDLEEERYHEKLLKDMEKAERSRLYSVMLEAGGLQTRDDLREEYREIPNTYKRRDGLPGDEMAEYLSTYYPEFGVDDERDLVDFLAS